ncbi:MAG: adenosylcobalamin-dependent ribonucleoside-diphosphate reductase [Candidatus Kariarchaeaceae archaeon]|jgi:ribonucleoside-diphosphate reductase alpha chain
MTYTNEEVFKASLEYFKGDELAASVFTNKYALQDEEGNYLELTPDDMHKRMAREFSRVESKHPNSLSGEEIYSLFKDFKYIVPQGSPMSGIGNEAKIQSLSNCFVIEAPADSYAGILKTDQEQVQIMKRRGGVGFDVSTIRPKGMFTSNAAKTTDGIEVFLDRFSNSCREVAQGGRRGALMLSISVHHPQVMDFIKIKRDLTRVTGANISVRVTDEFMNAVKHGDHYQLRWPVESIAEGGGVPEVEDEVLARDVWDALIEGAHASAEPGILFWDTATRMTPSDAYTHKGFGSVSTNPCGEIILSPYDSCRLMLVNLTSFVTNPWTPRAQFDYGQFRLVAKKAQRLMDDMIDLEIEQVDKILDKIDNDPESDEVKYYERSLWHNIRQAALNGRRTGLGITGLGDALAMLGQRYGSDDSIQTTEEIYKWLTLASYEESIQLAKERGAFPIWDLDAERNHQFISRVLSELMPEVIEDYKKYGRRNIANTTTAPAGSVSCLTQTTSGIEPAFMLYYKRRKKVQGDEEVMFVDDVGDKWTEFNVYHHKFQEWVAATDADCDWDLENETDVVVSHSPYAGATANEIDWRAKVKLQSVAQKWICHAISNTTNLPADIDVETVKDIYMMGWELGCKGVTVYRDGSRSGVLISADEKQEEETTISVRHAPKRPELLECDIHHTSIKGQKWIVLVGLLDGKPYEVIGGEAQQIEIPRKHKTGLLTKRVFKTQNSKYDLTIGEGEDTLTVKDVVSVFDNPNHAGYTRVISTSLRHGVPVQFLVEQMQKDKEADLFSFSKVIARCLKNYIIDGTAVSDKDCPSCGASGSLVYQEGCVTCSSCGYGKCG